MVAAGERRRRSRDPGVTRRIAATAAVAAALTIGCSRDHERLRYPPVVVMSPLRLPGVVVRGASREWWRSKHRAVRYGDPLPVGVSMYCLRGTTRTDRHVRAGIIAADPRFFPLARHVELYVGRTYLGRFLVDDTGLRIVGSRIDVWTSDCGQARWFGIQDGTAVLVRAGGVDIRQTGSLSPVK